MAESDPTQCSWRSFHHRQASVGCSHPVHGRNSAVTPQRQYVGQSGLMQCRWPSQCQPILHSLFSVFIIWSDPSRNILKNICVYRCKIRWRLHNLKKFVVIFLPRCWKQTLHISVYCDSQVQFAQTLLRSHFGEVFINNSWTSNLGIGWFVLVLTCLFCYMQIKTLFLWRHAWNTMDTCSDKIWVILFYVLTPCLFFLLSFCSWISDQRYGGSRLEAEVVELEESHTRTGRSLTGPESRA